MSIRSARPSPNSSIGICERLRVVEQCGQGGDRSAGGWEANREQRRSVVDRAQQEDLAARRWRVGSTFGSPGGLGSIADHRPTHGPDGAVEFDAESIFAAPTLGQTVGVDLFGRRNEAQTIARHPVRLEATHCEQQADQRAEEHHGRQEVQPRQRDHRLIIASAAGSTLVGRCSVVSRCSRRISGIGRDHLDTVAVGQTGAVPEGLEVEIYRRVAETTIGREIGEVWVDDRCAPGGVDPALIGAVVTGTIRVGKLLVIETDRVSFGLHFGMAGRLIVDGHAPIERLEYASGDDCAEWDRVSMAFCDGGRLRVNDPRRWSRFLTDPDPDALGPDLLVITPAELASALAGTRRHLKAVLLDQRAVAGFGNMLVDEILWWAGISPVSTAGALGVAEIDEIHRCSAEQLPELLERGGSHTGVLSPLVRAGLPPCPRDGAALRRETVAGRTTIWCPEHQIVVR